MNWFEFAASIVGSLAWPVACVGMAIFLKRPLVELLGRTRTAKGFGAELSFGDRIEAARQIIEVSPAIKSDGGDILLLPAQEDESTQTAVVLQELTSELATSSATGSIIAAWVELENRFKSVADFNKIPWESRNIIENIRGLSAFGFVSERSLEAIHSLRKIRNDVAHGVGEPPTLSDAAAFRSAVNEIADEFGLNAGMHSWR